MSHHGCEGCRNEFDLMDDVTQRIAQLEAENSNLKRLIRTGPASYEAAKVWAEQVIYDGFHHDRVAYREKYEIGEYAKDKWEDTDFRLGMEYGVLMALDKIYGDLDFVAKRESPE